MKHVIYEYAGAAIAWIGSVVLLSVVSKLFMGTDALFAILIQAVIQGGS